MMKSGGRSRGRKKKGISTIIGIVIFFLIFILAVSSTFIWTDNTSKYLQAAKAELEEGRLRAQENLLYTVSNQTHILLVNPTSMLVVVNQIWDNSHNQVWNGTLIVPAFDQVFVNMTNTTNKTYKMVTNRGNIFDQIYYGPPYGGSPVTPALTNASGWNVTWYRYDGATSTTLGNNVHNSLDISWTFGGAWSFGTPLTQRAGFNATTKVIAKQNTIFAYLMLIDDPAIGNYSTINFTIWDGGSYFNTVKTQMPINTSYPSFFTFAVEAGKTYDLFVSYQIVQPAPTTVHSVTIQLINVELAPWE